MTSFWHGQGSMDMVRDISVFSRLQVVLTYSLKLLGKKAKQEELVPRWEKEGKGPGKLLIGARSALLDKICRLIQERTVDAYYLN